MRLWEVSATLLLGRSRRRDGGAGKDWRMKSLANSNRCISILTTRIILKRYRGPGCNAWIDRVPTERAAVRYWKGSNFALTCEIRYEEHVLLHLFNRSSSTFSVSWRLEEYWWWRRSNQSRSNHVEINQKNRAVCQVFPAYIAAVCDVMGLMAQLPWRTILLMYA
jgi:hypothetical protein